MKALLTLLLVLIGAQAGAQAPSQVGLRALSADGARAILTFGPDWLEVDLASGEARFIPPAPACAWNAAAYAPTGADYALTAICADDASCAGRRAGLWRRLADGRLSPRAHAEGRRFGHPVWAEGDVVLATETRFLAARATGLSDLRDGDGCRSGEARFVRIDQADGRAIWLDILPAGWTAVRIVAATDTRMIVEARVRNTGGAGYAAERTVTALCGREPEARPCARLGEIRFAEWRGGDWRLFPAAGRRLASRSFAVTVEELCRGVETGGRVRSRCRALVMREGAAPVSIDAPDGLFGDLALSADGAVLAALATGRGSPVRRFDLFDTATGAATDLSHLLTLSPPWREGP